MRFLAISLVLVVGILIGMWADVRSPKRLEGWPVQRPAPESLVEPHTSLVTRYLKYLHGDRVSEIREPIRVVIHRVWVLVQTIPVLALILTSGVLAGLIVRESARTARRFSSPTQNYLGKRLATVALVGTIFFPLAPLSIPPWFCYAGAVVMTLGAYLYVANLPVRL